MNNIDVLWTTDPGIVALVLLVVSVIFVVAWLTKVRRNVYLGIAFFLLLIFSLMATIAVLGVWDMPVIDYFNYAVPAVAT